MRTLDKKCGGTMLTAMLAGSRNAHQLSTKSGVVVRAWSMRAASAAKSGSYAQTMIWRVAVAPGAGE